MEKRMVEELIAKYNASQASASELKTIEQLIESGDIELTTLNDLTLLDDQILNLESPMPSVDLDDRFYRMLAEESEPAQAAITDKIPEHLLGQGLASTQATGVGDRVHGESFGFAVIYAQRKESGFSG